LIKNHSEIAGYSINLYYDKTNGEEVNEEEGSKTDDKEIVTEVEDESKKKIKKIKKEKKEKKKKKVKIAEHKWKLINKKIFWTYSQSKLTDDEYSEFYKALTKD
jgi:DNA-directed RNA polymerase subunit M/transcription elongation factor TFIIS